MHGAVSTVLHLQGMSMSLAHIVPHFAFVYVGLLVAKEEAGLGVQRKLRSWLIDRMEGKITTHG